MPLSEEELHAIHMTLRRSHAKRLRKSGNADLARILEDENITTKDFKEMTERTKRNTEKICARATALRKAINELDLKEEQYREKARAAKRQRRELEKELDALFKQRKRARYV